jgi:hypothetical protein
MYRIQHDTRETTCNKTHDIFRQQLHEILQPKAETSTHSIDCASDTVRRPWHSRGLALAGVCLSG